MFNLYRETTLEVIEDGNEDLQFFGIPMVRGSKKEIAAYIVNLYARNRAQSNDTVQVWYQDGTGKTLTVQDLIAWNAKQN